MSHAGESLPFAHVSSMTAEGQQGRETGWARVLSKGRGDMTTTAKEIADALRVELESHLRMIRMIADQIEAMDAQISADKAEGVKNDNEAK